MSDTLLIFLLKTHRPEKYRETIRLLDFRREAQRIADELGVDVDATIAAGPTVDRCGRMLGALQATEALIPPAYRRVDLHALGPAEALASIQRSRRRRPKDAARTPGGLVGPPA